MPFRFKSPYICQKWSVLSLIDILHKFRPKLAISFSFMPNRRLESGYPVTIPEVGSGNQETYHCAIGPPVLETPPDSFTTGEIHIHGGIKVHIHAGISLSLPNLKLWKPSILMLKSWGRRGKLKWKGCLLFNRCWGRDEMRFW